MTSFKLLERKELEFVLDVLVKKEEISEDEFIKLYLLEQRSWKKVKEAFEMLEDLLIFQKDGKVYRLSYDPQTNLTLWVLKHAKKGSTKGSTKFFDILKTLSTYLLKEKKSILDTTTISKILDMPPEAVKGGLRSVLDFLGLGMNCGGEGFNFALDPKTIHIALEEYKKEVKKKLIPPKFYLPLEDFLCDFNEKYLPICDVSEQSISKMIEPALVYLKGEKLIELNDGTGTDYAKRRFNIDGRDEMLVKVND